MSYIQSTGLQESGRDRVNKHTTHTLKTQKEAAVNAFLGKSKLTESIKADIAAQRKAQLYMRWNDLTMLLSRPFVFQKAIY